MRNDIIEPIIDDGSTGLFGNSFWFISSLHLMRYISCLRIIEASFISVSSKTAHPRKFHSIFRLWNLFLLRRYIILKLKILLHESSAVADVLVAFLNDGYALLDDLRLLVFLIEDKLNTLVDDISRIFNMLSSHVFFEFFKRGLKGIDLDFKHIN